MATVNDLQADIKDLRKYLDENMATKEELRQVRAEVATKEDLERFATKDDLKAFATKEDLKQLKEEIIVGVGDFVTDTLMPEINKDITNLQDQIDEIKAVPIVAHELKKKVS